MFEEILLKFPIYKVITYNSSDILMKINVIGPASHFLLICARILYAGKIIKRPVVVSDKKN